MTTDDDRRFRLSQLATRAGIDTSYDDVDGMTRHASVESLLAVLPALGVEIDGLGDIDEATRRFGPPAAAGLASPIVVWADAPIVAEISLPQRVSTISVTLQFESGGEQSWRLAADDLGLPASGRGDVVGGRESHLRIITLAGPFAIGFHKLVVEAGRARHMADVLVAPTKVAQLQSWARLWGVFAPVYSLPGGSGLGAHLGELAHLARGIDGLGGRVVGTLPMLSAWMGEPFDPSPYAPVSRRFWNELYIDLAALPEVAGVAEAAENLNGLRMIGHAANAKSRSFDYRHQYGYVRGVLEQVVAARPSWPQGLQDSFDAHLATHPEVGEYARFRAYGEGQGKGWRDWPEPQRSGTLVDSDLDGQAVAFHEYAQYAMARNLAGMSAEMRDREQRLYLDLPIGAHADGYDTWRDRDLFAWGVAAGAPPDDFFTGGQNWGFPPLKPGDAQGGPLRYFRDVVRHHMAVAGILRLDHVMGLHRLFWVPDGLAATDGVYVRYPRDELVATLAIESNRSDCVVVGEDLGTVPFEIREAMHEHGMLGMSVALFSQPAWAGAEFDMPDPDQLASVDTHDTPTFSAWMRGIDIDRRLDMGLLDDEMAQRDRKDRRQQVENLVGFLRARGMLDTRGSAADAPGLLAGLLRQLGSGDAPVVLVTLDDLAGEINPQNVPGTTVERPNWVQRLPFTVDELIDHERFRPVLEALQASRLGSYARARDDD